MSPRDLATVLPFVVASLLAGCLASSHDAGDGAVTPPSDGSAPVDGGVVVPPDPDAGGTPLTCTSTVKQNAGTKVDMLFIVDDSPSMVEEQASLAAQIPRLVTVMTTGDRNGDGMQDFQPVGDLHAGVVTVNMGVGGIPNVPTCMAHADFGDDGVLLTTPRVGGAGCAASYPPVLTFTTGGDPAQFATDLTCLARTGTMGCGFEQQLDATLKALLPSSDPTTFAEGTHGHGDELNAGFLRSDSVIVVVLVTDEDDCSTANTDIWNPVSSTHTGDLNLRCINYDGELYPITRFVNGLRSLRPDDPNGVVFAAITGVPEDLVGSSGSTDFDAMFADPRMMNHIDVSGGTSTLVPACSSAGRGSAAPGIRIAHVAQAFGENGVVESICAADFGPALDRIVIRVTNALGSTCLGRVLPRQGDGTIACDVEETLGGPFTSCSEIPGAIASRTDADGSVHCTIQQVAIDAATRASGAPPSAAPLGWFYDDYTLDTLAVCSSAGSRVRFLPTSVPPQGVTVQLVCHDAACG